MKQQLLKRIKQEGLIPDGARCLCALSGGCDSVSLLFLLNELKEEKKLTLYAVYVNHGLREAAAGDEAYCVRLCSDLKIPLIVYRENASVHAAEKGFSVEEAGRALRYQRFREAACSFDLDTVLTAHHQDDQAETLLLNLFRGSGLSGLAGIAPQRKLTEGITLIRPLLSFSRQQLEEFLKEEGVSWREDESNRDEAYSRNYIRNRLLPEIEERFPNASERIASAAAFIRDADRHLQYEKRMWLQGEDPGVSDTLPLRMLNEAETWLRPMLLQDFFRGNGGVKDVGSAHYEAALALLEKQSGSSLSLPGGRILLREQENLRIIPADSENRKEEEPPFYSLRLFPYEKDLKIPDNTYTKWIDYAIMNDHVCLRRRADGDFFYLPGGGKKLLARFLIDEKVPLSRRNDLWVLADGSHVIWAIGYRLSAAAYITDQTKTVAEITVKIRGKNE